MFKPMRMTAVVMTAGLSLAATARGALLSAWEFNPADMAGSNVAASGGNVGAGDARYTGVLTGGASVGGGALQLDGSSGYLDFGNNLNEIRTMGSYTISAWVNADSPVAAFRRIVEHEDNTYFWAENGTFRYTTHGTPGGAASQAVSTTNASPGNWQHVLVTVDPGQPANIYINGVLEGTSGSNQAAIPNNTQTFQIGARRSASGPPTNFWDGQIDDVAIFDGSLSPVQINALAGSGVYANRATPTAVAATPATQALWNFDDKAPGGSNVELERFADSSGNGRDMFTGGVGVTTSFIAGNPAYGDGSAIALTSNRDAGIFRNGFSAFAGGGPAAGPDINFGQDDSFTIEAMIRTDMTGVGAIVSKDVAGNQPSWWFRINGGNLQAIVDDTDPGNLNGLVNSATAVNDGEWHHVAFVRDALSDEVQLYLDYSLVGSATDFTSNTSFNTNDIRVGEFNGSANNFQQFIGDIDFVRISSGALETSQFIQPLAIVPEPAALSLLALAAVGLARRRRRLA